MIERTWAHAPAHQDLAATSGARLGGRSAILLSVWLLTACGGGSGGVGTPPPALPAAVSLSAPVQAEVGQAVALTSDATTPGLTYAWDFGDGSSSTEVSPAHAFTRPGEFTVTVTVGNGSGATRSATRMLKVGYFARLASALCGGAGGPAWCWSRAPGAMGKLIGVHFRDDQNGWAVGESGLALRSTDGGRSFTVQSVPTTEDLDAVHFFDADHGWIATNDPKTLLKTADGGLHWQKVSVPRITEGCTDGYAREMQSFSQQSLAYHQCYLMLTQDGGQSWLSAGNVAGDGLRWDAGSDRLADGNPVTRLWRDGVEVSSFKGYDTVQVSSAVLDPAAIWVLNSTRSVFTPALPVQVSRSVDRAGSWQSSSPGADLADTIMAADANHAWLLDGQGRKVLRTRNAGGVWESLPTPPTFNRWQVLDADKLWTGGRWYSRDGGASWADLQALAASPGADSVWPLYARMQRLDAERLVLGGIGKAYRSADAGQTWQRVFDNGEAFELTLRELGFWNAQQGLALSSWFLTGTGDGGASWQRVQTPCSFHASMQVGPGGTARLLCSSAAGAGLSRLLASDDQGKTWRVLHAIDVSQEGFWLSFHFVDTSRGWAITNNGQLLASQDGGQTWKQLAQLDTGRWSGLRFASAARGVLVPVREAVRPPQPVLWVTDDAGLRWRAVAWPAAGQPTEVRFVDAQTGWAVGTEGGLARTIDGGQSWTAVPLPAAEGSPLWSPHFIDADTGWVMTQSGHLFTRDGGKTWTSSSLSGHALFFIDRFTGWLLGSKGGVFMTATGGI